MAVPLSKDFIAAVRGSGDVVRLVSDYVPLKQAGTRLKGLCPFHNEKTPSFSVDPQLQLFYCFGCQTGGDVFKFVMLYEKLEFPEAVEFLARRWGVPLPKSAPRPDDDVRQRLLLVTETAAEFFQAQWSDPRTGRPAREYVRARGIEDEIASRFCVGYAPDAWDALSSLLAARGFKASEVIGAGLAVARKEGTGHYDRFRHRVIFPIHDAAGKVVAFGGRALGDAEPKYLNSPETPAYTKGEHLYGLDVERDAIRREGFAILVEGYLDLIALHQAGFQNAVASLGTALTGAQVRLLSRFAERVVVSYDGDAAGSSAAARSLEHFLERGFDVRVAVLPPGKDPDDFVREAGGAAYDTLVRQAPGYLEFLVRREVAARNLALPGEKVAAINALLPSLTRLQSAVERAAWAGKLSEALGIDDDLVLQELRNALKAAKPSIRHRGGAEEPLRELEARLVHVLLGSGEARRHAREVLDESDLEGTRVASIVRAILDLEAQGLPVEGPLVVDALPAEHDRDLLTRIAFRGGPAGGPEDVDGCLETLKNMRWKKESREVVHALATHDGEDSTEHLRRLMDLRRRMDAPHRQPTQET